MAIIKTKRANFVDYTAVLTISVNTLSQNFEAALNRAIDAEASITNTVAWFVDLCGGSQIGEATRAAAFTVASAGAYTLLGIESDHSFIFSCDVNSIPVVNGTVMTIGSYEVTINLQQCS